MTFREAALELVNSATAELERVLGKDTGINAYFLMPSEHQNYVISFKTVIHLSTKELSKSKIPIPTPLKEQQKIASILSTVDREINQEQTKLSKLQSVKRGLMQDLLTGRVRVNGLLEKEIETV